MEGVAPILHRLASAYQDAVREGPLRAGAGLLACRGCHCCGRVADWGARGVRAQWRPSPGAAALSKGWGGGGLPWFAGGGCGAGVLLAGLRLSVGWGGDWGVAPGLPVVPGRSPGASLWWLRGDGLTVSAPAPPVASVSVGLAVGGLGGTGGWASIPGVGPPFGGVHQAAGPLPPPAPGSRAGPHPRPPRPSRLRRLVAWHQRGGKGGGAAGVGGRGQGQRLVVSGLRVKGAPVCASVAPAASPTGGGACAPVVRTAGEWGWRSGSGILGLPGGRPAPLVRSYPSVSAAWGPAPRLLGARLLPPGVAVTCAAACMGAWAAAAAGSSGGSASG